MKSKPEPFSTGAGFLAVSFLIAAFLLPSKSWAGEGPEYVPNAYPEPRYPNFLESASKEQLLEAARVAVRQTEGNVTLGLAKRGTTVHVLTIYNQDMEVWEAIKQAWAERGVTAVLVPGWEVTGMSKEAYEARAEANLMRGPDGWKEYGVFEPDYMEFLSPAVQEEMGEPLASRWIAADEKRTGARPDIEYLFVGEGGGGRRAAQHGEKFLGNWTYQTKSDLMSKDPWFPSDLWKMIDETIVRPIALVSEGTFYDPQGTKLHWTQTREQSEYWDKTSGLTSYGSGHLNVYPPPQEASWSEGVIVANANHVAFYPEMTVRISEHGRVTDIEGGGKGGDLFRMLFNHPRLADVEFPSAPEPGYWYLSQDGMGTNPKTIRNLYKLDVGSVEKPNLIERRRAGVQHFSFSSPVGDSLMNDEMNAQDVAYAKERGIPLKHTAHMHVYFGTLKWRLRDTGEWITIADKGQMAVFENPEVRALASKYGDPDVLFSYDWVPSIPGINVPGDYEEDFASDPWGWISSVWESIQSGSYKYFVEDYDMFAPASEGE